MAVRKKTYGAIGFWPSAGGPTLGIQQHFEILAHFTDGGFGYETRQLNWPHVEEHTEWPEEDWPLSSYSGVDFMYGAPPCAPFSSLGKRGHGWEGDDRIAKADVTLEAGLTIRPKIWMMESVLKFFTKATSWIENAEKQWVEAGYSVTHFITGSILHGVPQRRLRWHMIAHRIDLVFPEYPNPKIKTIKDALKHYGVQKGLGQAGYPPKLDRLYEWTPPGGRLRSTFLHLAGIREPEDRGKFSGIPGIAYRRLRWNASTPVITGAPRQFMPEEKRLYSVGEGLAFCGFPSTFKMEGGLKDRYAQIGKGILPPVAEYLGAIARASLEQNKKIKRPEVNVVNWKDAANKLISQNPRIEKLDPSLWNRYPEWRKPKDKYDLSWEDHLKKQGRKR